MKNSTQFLKFSKLTLAVVAALSAPTTVFGAPVVLEWITTAPAAPPAGTFEINIFTAVNARLTVLDNSFMTSGRLFQNSTELGTSPTISAAVGLLSWNTLGASGWDGSLLLSETRTCPPLLNPDGSEALPGGVRTPSFIVDLRRDTTIGANAFVGSLFAAPIVDCSRAPFAPRDLAVTFVTGASGGFVITNNFSGAGGFSGSSPRGYWNVVSNAVNIPVPSTIGLLGLGLFACFRARKVR